MVRSRQALAWFAAAPADRPRMYGVRWPAQLEKLVRALEAAAALPAGPRRRSMCAPKHKPIETHPWAVVEAASVRPCNAAVPETRASATEPHHHQARRERHCRNRLLHRPFLRGSARPETPPGQTNRWLRFRGCTCAELPSTALPFPVNPRRPPARRRGAGQTTQPTRSWCKRNRAPRDCNSTAAMCVREVAAGSAAPAPARGDGRCPSRTPTPDPT
ncbi:hypothetical protein C2845_PM11G19750 [Panicum miliaceum]|uniref:Uncharacterized protein n=1 Tax=Panicum miliaceum TaxID=4540 RepID=A0A3L6RUH5_PANMI|nr:hypothetical protein C2845_PM11G19750 [Panicum miliaceum]